MASDLAMEAKVKKLCCKWERARMSSALYMNSMVVNKESEFKLEDVHGSVHTTQKITIEPFENITVSGILKGQLKTVHTISMSKSQLNHWKLIKKGKINSVLSLGILSLNQAQIE